MTYIQAPDYPYTVDEIVGSVFIAGPRFNALYIVPTNMGSGSAGGAGTFVLSLFTGSVVEEVTSTQDFYTIGVQRFAGKPHLLRVRPTGALSFLAGIPVSSAVYDYPYARVKLSASGTPVGGMLDFLPYATARGQISIPSPASWGKNADPYEHYGDLQSGAPVVRGLYNRGTVGTNVVAPSTTVGGSLVYWLWVDGLLDRIDPSKIHVNASYASAATFVPGFGGQLVRLAISVSPSVDTSTAVMTFDAGAMVRAGLPSASQTFALSVDHAKRFVPIMHVFEDAALADKFVSGIEVPPVLTDGMWKHLVPVAESAVQWSNSGSEDDVHVALRATGTEIVQPPAAVVAPATPSIANTVVGQSARGASANYRTADRCGVITPLVCAGPRGTPAAVTLFKAPYLTAAQAVNLTGDIYNVTRDQWQATYEPGLVWEDITYPQPPLTLIELPFVQPAGWEDGDICVCIGTANTVWPCSTPPCIRFPSGAYPLSKATGVQFNFSYNITLDWGDSTILNPTPPTICRIPAAFKTVGYVATYTFDPFVPATPAELVAAFEAMNPIRVKLAPFTGSHELLPDGATDISLFTVDIATIGAEVTYTARAAPLFPVQIWTPGSYDPGAQVVWPGEVPGANVYQADASGASGVPGDDPAWVLVSAYSGPVSVTITVAGTAPGAHPVHDIGYLSVFTDADGDVLDPAVASWIVTSGGSAYAIPDYPLHMNVLRSKDEAQPGMIWSGEVALPLLAP